MAQHKPKSCISCFVGKDSREKHAVLRISGSSLVGRLPLRRFAREGGLRWAASSGSHQVNPAIDCLDRALTSLSMERQVQHSLAAASLLHRGL